MQRAILIILVACLLFVPPAANTAEGAAPDGGPGAGTGAKGETRPAGLTLKVLNHGVYQETAPGGFLEFKERAQNVQARVGTLFGVQFEIVGPGGADRNAPVDVQIRLSHPAFKDPRTGKPVDQDNWNVRVKPGEPSFAGFLFDAPWKIAQGVWTFEFLHKGAKLADFSFQITPAKDIGHTAAGPRPTAASSQVVGQTVGPTGGASATTPVATPVSTTGPAPGPAPGGPDPKAQWGVLAEFQQRENAETFTRKLKDNGFGDARYVSWKDGGKDRHAALAGTFESQDKARERADKFESVMRFRPAVRKLEGPALAAVSAPIQATPAQAPQSQPAQAPQAAPPTQVAGDDKLYVVKVGSFSQEDNARKLAQDLAAKGFKPAVEPKTDAKGATLYVVTLGSYKDMKKALEVQGDYQNREKRDAVVLSVRSEPAAGGQPAQPPVQNQAQAQPAPATQSAPPAQTGKTLFMAQIAEFGDEAKARELLASLREQGYSPCMVRDAAAKRFAVVLGPWSDRSVAETETLSFNEMERRRASVRPIEKDAFQSKAVCR